MKKSLVLFVLLTLLLSLCACQGNLTDINLKEPIAIPENGEISGTIMAQLQQENAIGIFTGVSNGIAYEWTIFGSDVTACEPINLAVVLEKNTEGNLQVRLRQQRGFGFSGLLSIDSGEAWVAQSATAYAGNTAIASVSVTGSKTAVLNLMLDGSAQFFEIRPDALPEDAYFPEASTEAIGTEEPSTTESDSYLSSANSGDDTVYTNGKDKYLTDPVPEGMPTPVEPEDVEINTETTLTCTFSIECSTILNNLDMLDPDKLEMVPSGGVILSKTTVVFYEGESVFDVLQRLCKERGIHMESEWTPIYNSAYIEGIHNLYEFDCGALSGWMYKVNGWYPNYGCSRYQLKAGDVVEWRYTCDLGNDVGGSYAVGG